jgi:iron-sulfur cluster assembly protein
MRYLTLILVLACLSCAKQSDQLTAPDMRSESTHLVEPVATAPNPPAIADTSNPITLTPAAAAQVRKFLAGFSPKHHLRATVKGSGCAGLTDNLDIDDEFDPDRDIEFLSQGVRIVMDKKSVLYLRGSTIDWVSTGAKTGFSIANPNRKPKEPEAKKQAEPGAAPEPAM